MLATFRKRRRKALTSSKHCINDVPVESVIEYRDTLIAITKVLLGEEASPDDEQAQSLCTWSDETAKNLRQDHMSLSDHLHRKNLQCAAPKLLALLRDALLSHRWRQVNQLMSCLAKEVHNTAMTILKVGLEAFKQDGRENSARLEKYLSQLTLQPELIVKEILLEHIFSLILTQQFEDVARPRFTAAQRHSNSVVSSSERAKDVSLLHDAYTGLALYGCWLVTRQRLDRLQQHCAEGYSHGMSDALGSEREDMNLYAEKAIVIFGSLTDEPGVWDIFVSKHVELLEYFGRLEEALLVLKANATRNPDNPYALRQLYEFYSLYGYSQRLQTNALQEFCKLQPADELVLRLHSLLHPAGLSILFDLLDYACWRDRLQPWLKFSEHLTQIYKSREFTELDACWSGRAPWWPVYHFSEDFLENDPELYLHKAIAAVFLLGPNEYTTKAAGCLDDCDAKLRSAMQLQTDNARYLNVTST